MNEDKAPQILEHAKILLDSFYCHFLHLVANLVVHCSCTWLLLCMQMKLACKSKIQFALYRVIVWFLSHRSEVWECSWAGAHFSQQPPDLLCGHPLPPCSWPQHSLWGDTVSMPPAPPGYIPSFQRVNVVIRGWDMACSRWLPIPIINISESLIMQLSSYGTWTVIIITAFLSRGQI